jgi:hypothetical protein
MCLLCMYSVRREEGKPCIWISFQSRKEEEKRGEHEAVGLLLVRWVGSCAPLDKGARRQGGSSQEQEQEIKHTSNSIRGIHYTEYKRLRIYHSYRD